jgi:4-hydroxy-tetrahydrodipicolinate synthase
MIVQGVYAAVLIPRLPDGELDTCGWGAILEFLRGKGLTKIVVNGATGEYCLTTARELSGMLAICRETLPGADVLCSIGAAGLAGCLELGRIAIDGGARALLLPMPHFFPYAQTDLHAFCAAVAARLDAPILLYNLPRFTTPLTLETVCGLIDGVPNIIGIKDSSGSLGLLGGLSWKAHKIVGDDGILVAALDAGLCDGVVSGVAGVLPEVTTFLFHQRKAAAYPQAVELLTELIRCLVAFPVPWGLKLIAECRGITPAWFSQPLSVARTAQADEFRAWFPGWWARWESAVAGCPEGCPTKP